MLPGAGASVLQPRTFKLYSRNHIQALFERHAPHLDPLGYVAAATVFPMRTNNYVVEELINWSKVPNDPIFKLVFPQPDMLSHEDFNDVRNAILNGSSKVARRDIAESIRIKLNPHPASQKTENVPYVNGEYLDGIQHKFRETMLFFPTEGQYCHSFCTYCFRWAQFTSVGSEQQFKSKDVEQLVSYIRNHPHITDILFTGGDPMVMRAHQLARYIDAILADPGCGHLGTIRIGSKSLAYWPYRYVTDPDSTDVLDIFKRVVHSGRHLSIMAHFSHPVELESPIVQEAIRRIRMTGANIRCQAPLVKHVNNSPDVWEKMWRLQTRLGAIPYYMFIEQDTGPRHYFEVPLAEAYEIYKEALSRLSGTARTVHGPTIATSPGKIQILGITHVPRPGSQSDTMDKVFVLRFLQSRNPAWAKEVFFAEFDERAVWLDDLKPAFGATSFFFEDEYRQLRALEGSSGQYLSSD